MKCPKCNSKDIVEGFSFTAKGEPDLESFICDECGNEWNKWNWNVQLVQEYYVTTIVDAHAIMKIGLEHNA